MLRPGESFDRYTIEAPLGQGGMGVVYRAHDTRLERRVALKLISDGLVTPETTERLLREARAAAALDHPNAVAIFDVGVRDDVPYIVMELVSGQTLRSAMGSSVPIGTRIDWLTDVARALAAAHRRSLVHRDVKPENIMVRDDGVVKVLDFGIARRQKGSADPTAPTQAPALPTLTQAGMRMGTPLYMAPEQIRGLPVDGRADQFAWGVVAFELLTGLPPWRGGDDALAIAASILTDDVDGAALDRSGVPGEVAAVILRTLSRRPEDRFASMEDVLHALAGSSPSTDAPKALDPPRAAAPKEAVTESAKAPASGTSMARFSTQEVRDVLIRAVERQEAKRADLRLNFDELVDAAREVGVDADVLREATREIRGAQSQPLRSKSQRPGPLATTEDADVDHDLVGEEDAQGDEGAKAWLRRRRRAFFRHFGMYVIVNAALAVLGVLTGTGAGWVVFPALGWGIGVAAHALTVLTAGEEDYREYTDRRRRYRERRDRRRMQKRRMHEAVARFHDRIQQNPKADYLNVAVEEGVRVLIDAAASRRGERFPTPPPDRLRVVSAPTPGRTAAEEEAAAELEGAREARRERGRREDR